MNNHGFTLVELLATIVIISLIGGIGVVAYTNLIAQSGDNVFKRYEDSMHAEAVYKVKEDYYNLNFDENNEATLNIYTDLKMDAINNPKTKSDKCPNSYVKVKRQRTEGENVLSITYKVCLICNDYRTTTTNSDGTTTECKIYEN